MSTIHGRSHKAIHFFRESPAALAVYWLYCARCNSENVAWPSLDGLIHDAAWSQNPIREARAWLVEHGALRRLKGYVRPEWRRLPEAERKRKLARDRAQYYRVTGVIVIAGTTYPLLYAPSEDAEEDTENEVSPRDTSPAGRVSPGEVSPRDVSPRDVSPRDPELDSNKELDSSSDLDSNNQLDSQALPLPAVVVDQPPADETAAAAAVEIQPDPELLVIQEEPAPPAAGETAPIPSSGQPLPPEARAAWNAAFHQLELQLDRASFETWLRDSALLGVEAGIFVVGVPNAYARDMLQHRLYRTIRRVLSDVYGQPVELRFEVQTAAPAASDDAGVPLFRLLAQEDAALLPSAAPVIQPATDAEVGELTRLFADNVQTLTPLLKGELVGLIGDCGADAVRFAIGEAVGANARNLRYVAAVARRKSGTGQRSAMRKEFHS